MDIFTTGPMCQWWSCSHDINTSSSTLRVFTDDELPMFPVESDFMAGVKYRVDLAREIDKEEHRYRSRVSKHVQVFLFFSTLVTI